MKQWIVKFISEDDLKDFVDKNDLKDKKNILIQVNSGTNDMSLVASLQKAISNQFPCAVVAGMSGALQVSHQKIYEREIILSITYFKTSTISSIKYKYSSIKDIDYEDIILKMQKGIKSDTKGILLLSANSKFDSERLVSNINRNFSHIPLFGGIASSHELSDNTYLFTHDEIFENMGLIAVFLHGEQLNISCGHFFDWEGIGKEFTVTKADGCRLGTLDGMSLQKVYEKYFGPVSKEEMITLSLAHPLIRKSEEFGYVGRALVEWDGECGIYTGEFKEGEKVQIGFGNYQRMISRYENIPKTYADYCVEVLWFYACVSYRYGYLDIFRNSARFFKEDEPIYGAMTFGEFTSDEEKNLFLNFTLTRVLLSEDKNARIPLSKYNAIQNKKDALLATLSTLVSSSSKEIAELNHHLEYEVKKRTKELESLNKSLERRIALEVKKNREKEKLLFHQSKLASMGEMISNIAHQWRQPLNIIALVMQDLSLKSKIGNLSPMDIDRAETKIHDTLNYLSSTIDDFRSFVANGEGYTQPGAFEVNKTVQDAIRLVSVAMDDEHIKYKFSPLKKEALVKGSGNDLKQVLLNLVYNAIDVIKERNIKNGKIIIEVKHSNKINIIVKDNAGGIEDKIIDKIFEPYFTTKYQSRGTGLGLYMSKMIVEKRLHGEICVRNSKSGAAFWITLPIYVN